MKKFSILMMVAMVAMMFVGCKSTKEAVKTTTPFGEVIETPCMESSYDDEFNFRELGTGKDTQLSIARKQALQNAQSMINDKLARLAKGLSTDYTRTMEESGKMAATQRALEGEITSVVERKLNDAQKICEKHTFDNTGNYNVFYTIQISKEELLEDVMDQISENDELRIEFNRDRFRKYAKEYMKDYEDYKKNQNK